MESSTTKHLIFDFFGTLVGYTHGYLSGGEYIKTHEFLLENGFRITYEKFEISFSNCFKKLEDKAKITNKEFSMNDVVKLFFADNSWKMQNKTRDKFLETYHLEWNRHIIYYPELKPFLNKLKENYALSIITNTHYKPLIYYHLREMGISNYFKLVLTSVECGIRKPDPRIFQKALQELATKPEAAIFVGDSYAADYQGALSAGIRGILIDPKHKWQGVVGNRVDSLFDILS